VGTIGKASRVTFGRLFKGILNPGISETGCFLEMKSNIASLLLAEDGDRITFQTAWNRDP
jgi:hypothetical protein